MLEGPHKDSQVVIAAAKTAQDYAQLFEVEGIHHRSCTNNPAAATTTAERCSSGHAERSKDTPRLSIVVPFYNEEGNVTELYGRLHVVIEDIGWPYQLVFVDDGSTDDTYRLLSGIARIDPLVTVIRLRRNFGQTAALAAGFAHSKGEYVIAMDGDLQHDPAEIPVFLKKVAEGYDIVSGWRSHRVDNLWLRRIPSRCANWLMAKLSGVEIHDFGTTFKAYRGTLLRQLPLYGEMHRFIPAIASAYGASICEVPIHNNHRTRGVSHYGISRTFRVLFDLITIRFLLRYMSRPLHFFGRIGLLNMTAGFTIALWLALSKVVYGANIVQQHGPFMVFAAVLILLGFQLLALGLLGELAVWQYFNRAARTPYSIRDVHDGRGFTACN
jgi:glycosyltransferase involved in cell wall biosynthesis